MKVKPLTLRKVSLRLQQAKQRLSNGVRFTFAIGKHEATFTLLPDLLFSSDPNMQKTNIRVLETRQTSGGHIHITNSFRLIQRLCTVPITVDDAKKETFIWRLALHQLADPFNTLFGDFTLSSPKTDVLGNDDSVAEQLRFQWHLEAQNQTLSGLVRMPTETFLNWLNCTPWQNVPTPEYNLLNVAKLAVDIPLTVGKLHLFNVQVRKLSVGDVVLPQETMFDLQGNGILRIATQKLTLQWQHDAQFLVTDIQDDPMSSHSAPTEEAGAAGETAVPTETAQAHAAQVNEGVDTPAVESTPAVAVEGKDDLRHFDDLELLFTIEVGDITLSLDALRALSPGAILTASNMTLGNAVLRHRNRIVGRGELVDVEGRMGLQLQSIEAGHAH